MVQAAAAQGIPCKLSYTAGAYVCNDLFYRLLHQYRGTGVLVDFIHVPFLPEQAKNGEPSMALADMARDGFMDQQLTSPLHPGAERFYMELADL